MTYSIVLILTLVIKPFVATVGWWVCRAANHNATLYLSFTSFLQENIQQLQLLLLQTPTLLTALSHPAYLWQNLKYHKITYSIVLILTLAIGPFVATVCWWMCRAANLNATSYLSSGANRSWTTSLQHCTQRYSKATESFLSISQASRGTKVTLKKKEYQNIRLSFC